MTGEGFEDIGAAAMLEVRPGAWWPWLVLLAGVVAVCVVGAVYSAA